MRKVGTQLDSKIMIQGEDALVLNMVSYGSKEKNDRTHYFKVISKTSKFQTSVVGNFQNHISNTIENKLFVRRHSFMRALSLIKVQEVLN